MIWNKYCLFLFFEGYIKVKLCHFLNLQTALLVLILSFTITDDHLFIVNILPKYQ